MSKGLLWEDIDFLKFHKKSAAEYLLNHPGAPKNMVNLIKNWYDPGGKNTFIDWANALPDHASEETKHHSLWALLGRELWDWPVDEDDWPQPTDQTRRAWDIYKEIMAPWVNNGEGCLEIDIVIDNMWVAQMYAFYEYRDNIVIWRSHQTGRLN
jgi:hypothetical protein